MRPIEMAPKDREDFISRIRSTFEEKGLAPMDGIFNIQALPDGTWSAIGGRCCPLGAVLHGTPWRGDPPWNPSVWESIVEVLGWSWSEGLAFVHGFDGRPLEGIWGDALSAFELGRMARGALLPAR